MDAVRYVLIALAAITPATVEAGQWRMQPVTLATPWAASVSPTNVWPEYPRPQMVRPDWQNLNGLWEYAITAGDAPAPQHYSGQILVPYPVESALSGVKKPLRADQLLWYRRTLQVAPAQAGERVLLHFGAVDYEATVYLNGKQLGAHSGGYQSFTFEITAALRTGDNELIVKVYDPTELGPNAQGKQNVNAQWMYYSASSGIWQTVWIERVPTTYIEGLKLTPDVDRGEVRIEVDVNGEHDKYSMEAIVRNDGRVVARQPIHGPTALRIDRPRLWFPDDPHLYDLELRLLRDGNVVDSVNSYFGLRKIELKRDSEGRARINLNNRYTFNLAVVDQGYWPDGLYTAPSDAALKFDVQAAKALGFNTVRKHIKVEPQRWYYHCDRLGLLVWQDMPVSKNDSVQARNQFEREIRQNMKQLHNHPSITTWVLFNEGWGAYETDRLAQWMKQTDPSRLLNGHSGPYDQVLQSQWGRKREISLLLEPLGGTGPSMELQAVQLEAPESWMVGDMADVHFYPGPRMFPARVDKASVTGEHGSLGVYIEDHVWDELARLGMGLGGAALSPQQFLSTYANSTREIKALEKQGLSGSAYFELYDVEGEHQGFLTYDRALAKFPFAEIARINGEIVPRASNYDAAVKGFSVRTAQWMSDPRRYESLLEDFRKGRLDLMSLRRLALIALRLGHKDQATEAANEFIRVAPRPYSKETWRSVIAMTHSSQDKGFDLLRSSADEVNAAMGGQTAQKKILEIVGRELITPYFQDKQRGMSWKEFEDSVVRSHGELGREAVIGALMMDNLVREDWSSFGASFARYFETAIPRSPYALHALSYRVLKHVNHPEATEAAVRVMRWQMSAIREWPVSGRYDPIELDTYANLLHRAGRVAEALEWQQKAVDLSDGRDKELVANLRRMRHARSGSSAETATSWLLKDDK